MLYKCQKASCLLGARAQEVSRIFCLLPQLPPQRPDPMNPYEVEALEVSFLVAVSC